MVFSSGIHYSTESTEGLRIKCLVQGHNIPMQAIYCPEKIALANEDYCHLEKHHQHGDCQDLQKDINTLCNWES